MTHGGSDVIARDVRGREAVAGSSHRGTWPCPGLNKDSVSRSRTVIQTRRTSNCIELLYYSCDRPYRSKKRHVQRGIQVYTTPVSCSWYVRSAKTSPTSGVFTSVYTTLSTDVCNCNVPCFEMAICCTRQAYEEADHMYSSQLPLLRYAVSAE